MDERMIEIANFGRAEEAEMLVSLLQSEGIESYVRNAISSRVLGWSADIGARVETLESQVPRALEIMRDAGYELPADSPDAVAADTPLARRIPVLRRLSYAMQVVIVVFILVGVLALFLFLQSWFSTH